MANEEHLAILRQGVYIWNQWREDNPDVIPDLKEANLTGSDLREADLKKAVLKAADLSEAKLEGATFHQADLQNAKLFNSSLGPALSGEGMMALPPQSEIRAYLYMGGTFVTTDLSQANLNKADLEGAYLGGTNLSGANLYKANLHLTYLLGANLDRTDLSRARVSNTVWANLDLRLTQGLDTVQHEGPSTIGIDTLYRSKGQIPEVFLRGCGVPDSMIEYARALVAAERPIDYYSCFISYSSHDEALAERLYADLQSKGVRCWYAPHDMQIGEPILSGIDRGIRLHDKLLLILSEASVESGWVEQEVQMALAREKTDRRRVLFPIRIDDAVIESRQGWPSVLRDTIHIGDFRQWKEHDAYQAAFARLLRDLKAEKE